ncbi:hypothetical protein [Nocardia puris]|uniref:hypothetical protein n=1 Tax=Nocardia puris TaxID=208602 RepID=UPI001E31B9D3|nr:hypothetical protein [Nocardia puris]
MRRPRAMVLDEVWRGLDGVEALSGPHGGPLRRTVKLVLDPLVIRPVRHPACAGPLIGADGATLLASLVHAHADALRATAAWFTLLKQVRRGLRVTEGNPQDLYFQRCFELAVTAGHPDPARDRPRAEAALRDIHSFAAGRTTQALKDHLTDAERAERLSALIAVAWGRRPGAVAGREFAFAPLLEACVSGDGGELFRRLVASNAGTHTGISLWYREKNCGAFDLGLTEHPLPQPPRLGASASTADLGLPFDRTVYERVFTVLQASTERAELPAIPDLVTDEIARSCAPWALLDETLRVVASAGVALALGLSPIVGAEGMSDAARREHRSGGPRARGHESGSDPRHAVAGGRVTAEASSHREFSGERRREVGVASLASAGTGADSAVRAREGAPHTRAVAVDTGASAPHTGVVGSRDSGPDGVGPERSSGETAAHRVVNARWRREAYVLQARRLVVSGAEVEGPLGAIAEELRTPWRPYLRRLWVRLHGRDVRGAPADEPGELWDLLDGVARSVMLDHRTRVRKALSVRAAEPGAAESRAS